MASEQEVKQYFDAVDADHSGEISVHELQRALAMGSLNFSLAICSHMIRSINGTATTLSLPQFGKLHEFLTQVQGDFRRFDTDQNGRLSLRELEGALRGAGFQLDQPALLALFKSFDSDHDGELGLPEYIALTLFTRSSVATFRAFDPSHSGSVTFNFNQFIYACSNCRS